MVYRLLPPERLKGILYPLEGEFTEAELAAYNEQGYGIYMFPNFPENYDPSKPVDGTVIDTFKYVFVDMDLKDKVYPDKASFTDRLLSDPLHPTFIVDSGNGIHAYFEVSDLDAMSYLKLQRRLCRYFHTDEAVSKICQLMRAPDYVNTKHTDNLALCETLFQSEALYTCEELDSLLPPITLQDEEYCKQHYDKTYNLTNKNIKINDNIPLKFSQLLRSNNEVKEIWSGGLEDRSKGDYRLGHIMFASGFTKDEARSVLVNSAKALGRAPIHRVGYAEGIIEKIWAFETKENEAALELSSSVKDILSRHGDTLSGTRFPCYRYFDDTVHGFRLGQVLGLVAGVGVGKTAISLNLFEGFVTSNPDYIHFFCALEQPENEVAARWKALCGDNLTLHEKVHIISNYAADGSYRNLSLEDIQDHIVKFQQITGKKAGCVVIDHIGVLNKKGKEGFQSIEDICHKMKAFAVKTNTFLVMQSQAPREKAGAGDLELGKDAAYGTVFFEAYTDYLVTIWQPLKKAYTDDKCPKITAFKFCKIREKDTEGKDKIKEDVRYRMLFGPSGRLRELTQAEEKAFDFYNATCINLRKQDRKTEIVPYVSAKWGADGTAA